MRPVLSMSLTLPSVLSIGVVPAFAQTGPNQSVFDLGEIVVIGQRPEGLASVGGSVVTREQTWTLQKLSLDQALELAPGVVTTVRGRRNEADIFVRGFGRW